MEHEEPKIKVKVELELEVSHYWLEEIVDAGDIFMNAYCGYWLSYVDHSSELGTLAYEHNDEVNAYDIPSLPGYSAAHKAWLEGKELPTRWFALNKNLAIKAWVEGVKKGGTGWYHHGGSTTYDCALQRALFGEVKYG